MKTLKSAERDRLTLGCLRCMGTLKLGERESGKEERIKILNRALTELRAMVELESNLNSKSFNILFFFKKARWSEY
jgi:hypothetical protein